MARDDQANSKSENGAQAYAASWVDRFTDWVARLPGPSWSFYLGFALALSLVLVVVLWLEGAYPIGTFFPVQVFIPGMISLLMAMIHLLDNRAGEALTTLRPALKASEEEYNQLRYQLTTLPARPTLLASVAVLIIIFLLEAIGGRPDSIEALATSPISANLMYLVYMIGWWNFGAFLYHTIYQLGQINYIYTRHTRINLFALSPFYAFSGVTALTAVTLTVAAYGWTALNPNGLYDPVSVGMLFLITVLALAAFAWPLLGTRRLMAKEKGQMLDQVSLRLEAVFVELHQRMDNGNLEVDDLIKVISLLETERDTLKGVSTWPWQPETLRFLVTALVLPLLLWIIQFVLQRVLAP